MTELKSGSRHASEKSWTRTPPRLLAGIVAVLLGAFGHALPARAASGDSARFSNANHLLFMTDQLGNVRPPKRLEYSYSVSGGAENFNDHIDLELRRGNKQGKDVHVHFLSGKRHRYVPEITNARGNPVIAVFLQHDVYTLAQRSGGNWRFFQKRIKIALQNNAKIMKGSVRYHGRRVDTTRVTITPYARMSSHQSDMGKSLNERYVFTLADGVPGGVLKISSIVPGPKGVPDKTRQLKLAVVTPIKPAQNKSRKTDHGAAAQ